MTPYQLEMLGYLASFIVLVSLLMSSIIKLRWINLLGCLLFSVYGFSIGALPVAIMNAFITIINIYYLIKMYRAKEYFKLLTADTSSEYFKHFMDFYHKDIEKYADVSNLDFKKTAVSFYILRNLKPAGIFIASATDSSTLTVNLDFVIPEYRDFKIGTFIYEDNKEYLLEKGYKRIICSSSNNVHVKYLKKMGFKATTEGGVNSFIKTLA